MGVIICGAAGLVPVFVVAGEIAAEAVASFFLYVLFAVNAQIGVGPLAQVAHCKACLCPECDTLDGGFDILFLGFHAIKIEN